MTMPSDPHIPPPSDPPPASTKSVDIADIVRTEGTEGFAREVERALAEAPKVMPKIWPWVRVCDIPDPGPTQWLVQDLWTLDAFGIVGAEPKSWKSWLTLYIGICIASGRPVFDRFEVMQGRVVIFSAEGGTKLVKRRTNALCAALGIEIPKELIALDMKVLRLDDAESVEVTLNSVRALQPRLLVLDPLRNLHGGDENDAAMVATIVKPLLLLADEKCACMVVHHLSKQNPDARRRGSQRGGQRLRGSSALHGFTESALYLETEGEGQNKRVTVTAEHRDGAEPEPFTLALRVRQLPELRVWLEVMQRETEEEEAQREDREREAKRNQILRAIDNASKPGRDGLTSKNAVHKAVSGRRADVFDLVQELLNAGEIEQGPDRVFRIPHPEPPSSEDASEAAQPTEAAPKDAQGQDNKRAQVLEAIRASLASGQQLFTSRNAVYTAVGGRKNIVLQALRELEAAGEVHQDDSGAFRLGPLEA